MSPNKQLARKQRGATLVAAATAGGGVVRPSSERSPLADANAKAARVAAPRQASPRNLFPPPKPAVSAPPVASKQPDDGEAARAFSTPEGARVEFPLQFAGDEDARFSYRAGYVEGRHSDKSFKDVFDGDTFGREAFLAGFESGRIALSKVAGNAFTPAAQEVRETNLKAKAGIEWPILNTRDRRPC